MATDYGTIRVLLHPCLDYDQRVTIVKQSVENQLITEKREHFIEILHQCTKLSERIGNLTINVQTYEYRYTLILYSYEDDRKKHCRIINHA
jgi:V8-like Glu-specific endopeptidase